MLVVCIIQRVEHGIIPFIVKHSAIPKASFAFLDLFRQLFSIFPTIKAIQGGFTRHGSSLCYGIRIIRGTELTMPLVMLITCCYSKKNSHHIRLKNQQYFVHLPPMHRPHNQVLCYRHCSKEQQVISLYSPNNKGNIAYNTGYC